MRLLPCAAWAALVAAGFGYAWRYESVAGPSARASNFPRESGVRLDPSVPTVVMFAHPYCPCTVSGIEQLADLLRDDPHRARLCVVVVEAPGLVADLSKSRVAEVSHRVEGAVVLSDPGGKEAKRFGAATSGQTLAFDPQGDLLFRGGLNDVRGHYGPNAGIDALAAILDSKIPAVRTTPVYGCSLLGGAS